MKKLALFFLLFFGPFGVAGKSTKYIIPNYKYNINQKYGRKKIKHINTKVIRDNKLETSISRALRIIKDDFLINDDVSGDCLQESPTISIDSSGNFLVSWVDNWGGDKDIYGKIFNSYNDSITGSIRINDDMSTYDQKNPSVSLLKDNFIIVWEDDRVDGEHSDIYAQILNKNGDKMGQNFKVNEQLYWEGFPYNTYNETPEVVANSNGRIVVVWKRHNIYAQIFDSLLQKVDTNFKVSSFSDEEYYPDVGVFDNGAFVISWTYFNTWTDRDIYAKLFNKDGTPKDSMFKVNSDEVSGNGSEVGTCKNTTFSITWPGHDSEGYDDIYVKKFDSTGVSISPSILVNDYGHHSSHQDDPSIAMNDYGEFMIVWNDYHEEGGGFPDFMGDIYGQCYDSLLNTVGANLKVSRDIDYTTANEDLGISINNNGDCFIVWQDQRNSFDYHDIYARRYRDLIVPVGTDFQVVRHIGASSQRDPASAINSNDDMVVCWRDLRAEGFDELFVQRLDSLGNKVGVNIKVDNSTVDGDVVTPSVDIDGRGNFVTVWRDGLNEYYYIVYGQRFDSGGNPLGGNFQISEIGPMAEQCDIAMSEKGKFVVVWESNELGSSADDILAQLYDSLGNSIDTIFKVNNSSGDNWVPSVDMDDNGNFVVVWWDYSRGCIMGRRYDNTGSPIDSNFSIVENEGHVLNPCVTMNNKGYFSVAWQVSDDYGLYNIALRQFDSTCNLIGATIIANDISGICDYPPSVTMAPDDNRCIVTWTDFRNADKDPEIVTQLIENGNKIGNNLQINRIDPFPNNHQKTSINCVSSNKNKILFTWMDNRRTKSWDIYGKLFDWSLSGGEDITPPVINNTTIWEDTTYTGPFEIRTQVLDDLSGVDSVSLYYKGNEDLNWVQNLMSLNGGWYTDTIPQITNTSDTLKYYILAVDAALNRNVSTDPSGAPENYYSFVSNVSGIEESIADTFSFSARVIKRDELIFKVSLPERSKISLRIYDIMGRVASTPAEGVYPRGFYELKFQPKTKGIYFYRFKSSFGYKSGKTIIF